MRRLLPAFFLAFCIPRPVAADAPAIEVDYGQAAKPLATFWNSTGFSPADIVATREMTAMLKDDGRLPERGMGYVRPHYLLNLAEVRGMGTGRPGYDWSGLDAALDTITGSGLKLIFELMGFPSDGTDRRAIQYDKNFQEQRVRRKSYFDDLSKTEQMSRWRTFVTDLALHLESRYGRDRVRSWLFETTNEPNLVHFWKYDVQTFLNYYDACSEGLLAADPALKFGGPGSAAPDLVETFKALMAHCDTGRNAFTGQTGVRIDFISVHVKDQPRQMVERELRIIDYLRSKHPGLASKPFINDEADPIKGWAVPYWWESGPWHAAFVAQNVDLHQRLVVESAGVNYRLLSNDHSFMGDWNQRTTHVLFREQPNADGFVLIRKPVLSVMGLIAQLGDRVVDARVPSAFSGHFGVIASIKGDTLALIVYNKTEIKIENTGKPQPDVEVALMEQQKVEAPFTIKGIKGTAASIREWRIDETHGNPHHVWVSMGQPKILSEAQVAGLKTAEAPELIRSESIACPNHEYTYPLSAPSPSVSLIVIAPGRN